MPAGCDRSQSLATRDVSLITSELACLDIDSPLLIDRFAAASSIMNRFVLALWCFLTACRVCADSVVVFNEIHYQPSTEGTRREWIELENQLSVDVDISGWSIQEDARFRFPEGSVIFARAQLVIARDPDWLRSTSGGTNVMGPLEGSLPDTQGRLVLRNNHGRLMDEIRYSASTPWPASAAGQGASLSRRRGHPVPGEPAGWAASLQPGGNPGLQNFPTVAPAFRTNVWMSIGQVWRWQEAGAAQALGWFEAAYDDSEWNSGAAPFQSGPSALPIPVATTLPAGALTHRFRTEFTLPGSPSAGRFFLRGHLHDGAVGYLNGVEAFRYNMPAGPLNPSTPAPSNADPGDPSGPIAIPSHLLRPGRNLLAVQLHPGLRAAGYAAAVMASRPVAYWRFETTNGHAADESHSEGLQDGVFTGLAPTNRMAFGPRPGESVNGRFFAGFDAGNMATRFAGNLDGGNDVMTASDSTAFDFSSGAGFTLEAWVNGPATQESGAAIIARGTGGGGEQYALDVHGGRYRLFVRAADTADVSAVTAAEGPNGTWQHVAGVADKAGGVLRIFINGVERGSAPMTATRLLVTNHELSVGSRKLTSELYNLNFAGRLDDPAVYARPLSAEEILAHFDAAFVSFVPPVVDDGEMAMALEMVSYERVEQPDPAGPGPVMPVLSPQQDVVLNEIHYHPKGRMPSAAVVSNAVLVSFGNVWERHTQGVDLGSAWRLSEANDGGWRTSPAPFHGPSGLLIPLPKQTELPLTNTLNQRITTFYFRTQFRFDAPTEGARLTFRTLIDDGAVFYLNGVEVLRQNMRDGEVTYTNLSATAVSAIAIVDRPAVTVTNLVAGWNTLAVEVHQAAGASADIAFAMELGAIQVISPEMAYEERPGSWIELHNRGAAPADLSGCRLTGGVEFRFPPGQILAPGGYLVVAKDRAYMAQVHPGLSVLGPFQGRLSRRGEALELLDPHGRLMDQVRYRDDGRWPEQADGGGSSLELKNPFADNASAESWAASSESHRAGWQTFRWRGIARPGQAEEPNLWRELALCLLDGAGEVLLDDFSVVENPATAPRQLMWNGTFDGGNARYWRFMGNHRHSAVTLDPDDSSNPVLRLVSTGPGEYQGNQIETTLTNNQAVVDGREYEISFRARWVSGASLLNARLYFNRLARTFPLSVREGGGTPGVRNSRWVSTVGPTFEGLSHFPVVPQPGEPVKVRVRVLDDEGVAGCVLHFRAGTDAWQEVPMFASGSEIYEGVVPGYPAATVVQFFVEATDDIGAVAHAPARGRESRALYIVQDGRGLPPPVHTLRLLMTSADSTFLHGETNTLSNEMLGGTVIEDDEDVYYDVGVRLKGSFVGRNVARVGFNLEFGSEHPFRGVHPGLAIDRAFHTAIGNVSEMVVKHIACHAGGIPAMNDDIAWFLAPISSYNSMCTLRMSGFDSDWLDAQFSNGSEGSMFEVEVLRWNVATINGRPEGLKQVGNESGGTGYANLEVRDYGDDRESYRWFTLASNNRERDDFSKVMAWCKTLSLTSSNLNTRSRVTMDVDQWLRTLAFQTLVGPGDAYFTGGNIHNFRVYARPDDGRVMYFPWDWDSSFQIDPGAPLVGNGNIANLVSLPHNRRMFLHHVHDIIRTTFNRTYISRWTRHYGAVGRESLGTVESYIASRAASALSQVPTNTVFAITNNGGLNFVSLTNQIALMGTAPIMVREIEVNGIAYPVTWVANTSWRVELPLSAGANHLAVQGIWHSGLRPASALDTIIVTNAGPSALNPVVINEWMADNAGPGGFADPADGLFQDWFELYNPNSMSVDLGGFTLTDDLARPDKWRIPEGRRIAGRGHLLVWADNQPQQIGTAADSSLHAAFQLSAGGESIGLFDPSGRLQHAVRFGPQRVNISQGLMPDGNTNSVLWMADPTPGTANGMGAGSTPLIRSLRPAPGGGLELIFTSVPGLTCWVEHASTLNGATWRRVGSTIVGAGGLVSLVLGLDRELAGFYRVQLDVSVPATP